MTKAELREAFPGSEIWHEMWMGMTKSYVAYDGFGQTIEETKPATISREHTRAA